MPSYKYNIEFGPDVLKKGRPLVDVTSPTIFDETNLFNNDNLLRCINDAISNRQNVPGFSSHLTMAQKDNWFNQRYLKDANYQLEFNCGDMANLKTIAFHQKYGDLLKKDNCENDKYIYKSKLDNGIFKAGSNIFRGKTLQYDKAPKPILIRFLGTHQEKYPIYYAASLYIALKVSTPCKDRFGFSFATIRLPAFTNKKNEPCYTCLFRVIDPKAKGFRDNVVLTYTFSVNETCEIELKEAVYPVEVRQYVTINEKTIALKGTKQIPALMPVGSTNIQAFKTLFDNVKVRTNHTIKENPVPQMVFIDENDKLIAPDPNNSYPDITMGNNTFALSLNDTISTYLRSRINNLCVNLDNELKYATGEVDLFKELIADTKNKIEIIAFKNVEPDPHPIDGKTYPSGFFLYGADFWGIGPDINKIIRIINSTNDIPE